MFAFLEKGAAGYLLVKEEEEEGAGAQRGDGGRGALADASKDNRKSGNKYSEKGCCVELDASESSSVTVINEVILRSPHTGIITR